MKSTENKLLDELIRLAAVIGIDANDRDCESIAKEFRSKKTQT